MPAKFSFGNLQFDVSLGSAAEDVRPDPETPFGLTILGDFSGRASRSVCEPIDQRRIWRLDCDNFEEVMGKLGVRLRLPENASVVGQASRLPTARPALEPTGEGRTPAPLIFGCMDDFHPDRLMQQATPLKALFEQRKRLLDPSTAVAATAELQALFTRQPTPQPTQAPATAPAESHEDTLARLLGGAPERPVPPGPSKGGGGIERLIQNIVAPSIVHGASPQQTALLSVLDLELTNQLCAILHHPDFQALEAAWRGVDLLVRNFGAEENLKIYLLDISKSELSGDLQAQEALETSGLSKLIRRRAEDEPWAVWLGQYTFADSLADLETLGRLAKISACVTAPFISGASPHLVGCDSFGAHPDPDDWKQPIAAGVREAWPALRELPEASFLGLALPRFLLRQPYGKDSDPIESFTFEEMPAGRPHENYLWGNPAILCGYLLSSAFQAEGWEMQAAGYGEVGELPVHTFTREGEADAKPCAEAWLTERAGQAILEKGLMPVLSIKGRDAVRIVNLNSLTGTPLPIG